MERRLGVSTSTVQRLVRAGELEPIRFGRAVRFETDDVDSLIARRRAQGNAPAGQAEASVVPLTTTVVTGRDVEEQA